MLVEVTVFEKWFWFLKCRPTTENKKIRIIYQNWSNQPRLGIEIVIFLSHRSTWRGMQKNCSRTKDIFQNRRMSSTHCIFKIPLRFSSMRAVTISQWDNALNLCDFSSSMRNFFFFQLFRSWGNICENINLSEKWVFWKNRSTVKYIFHRKEFRRIPEKRIEDIVDVFWWSWFSCSPLPLLRTYCTNAELNPRSVTAKISEWNSILGASDVIYHILNQCILNFQCKTSKNIYFSWLPYLEPDPAMPWN